MKRALLSVSVLTLSILPQAARAMWPIDGSAVCIAPADQNYVDIVSDGAGGAIISWQDVRGSSYYDIYAQRIGASGDTLWTANGVALCTAVGGQTRPTIVSDGAGGAIIAWEDLRAGNDDIYAQRIGASGDTLWTANGVALATWYLGDRNLAIAPDGAGGAIVTWVSDSGTNSDIVAQRIDASGNALWGGGIVLTTWYLNDDYPCVATDGAGGAIITWASYSGTSWDIVAQRIDASGSALWGGGVVVTAWYLEDNHPQLVYDGAGGAVVTWESHSGTSWDIVAQRIGAVGNALWGGGVVVCGSVVDQTRPVIISDDAGGAIITWSDLRNDIYANRVGASGSLLWAPDGIPLCTADYAQVSPSIVSDGAGGAIVAWDDRRSANTDIYAQRVDASGTALWTYDGVALCKATGHQIGARMAFDGAAGAIAAWQDTRLPSNDCDVYAQRVTASGDIPTAVSGPTLGPSMRASSIHPNPFAGSASMEVTVAKSSSIRIDVFDVRGRRVRGLRLLEVVGTRRIELLDRDDTGRLLPCGVYFCRVDAGGERLTRKMVIVR
jgi:hypothetical protein